MDRVWDQEMDDAGKDRDRTHRSGGGFNKPPKSGSSCPIVLGALLAPPLALATLLLRRRR